LSAVHHPVRDPAAEAADLRHLRTTSARAGVDPAALSLPRHLRVRAGDLWLGALDWGGAAGRTALFVHGSGQSAHTWDVTCAALREDAHCVAIDMRGHGESEWAPDGRYTLDVLADDIAAAADALDLERFVLVGMSLGGLASLVVATRLAARLDGLVVVDANPLVELSKGRAVARSMQLTAGARSIDEVVRRAARLRTAAPPDALRYSLARNLRVLGDGRVAWKYDPAAHTEARRRETVERGRRLWDELDAVTCRTLVLNGEASAVVSGEDARRLAARLPDARAVSIAGAGHSVQTDAPGPLAAALRDFLRA
jgi:pimeloyl-ACP methyl ester carboxylesterase